MLYPSVGDLLPEQLRAIGEAKNNGSAVFNHGGITYAIAENNGDSVILARKGDENVGYIATSPQGVHYAIEVPTEHRGRGIGTLLLRTKEALDGILSHEWSGRYSRIIFLINRGYVPDKKILEFSNISQDRKISKSDKSLLVRKLQEHVRKSLKGDTIDDISGIIFRMKYAPGRARKFIRENELEKK